MKTYKVFSSCADLMRMYSDTRLLKEIQDPKEALIHQLIHLIAKQNLIGNTDPSNLY